MVSPADWTPLIPDAVLFVIDQLDQQGYEAWLVGGCVRDLAIGRTPLDFDLSTRALPEQVLEIFPKTFATGIAHGTVTVLIDHYPVEVTTYRSESDYSDNRRPDRVVFETDLILDLSRRDFTINSMAYHPKHGLRDPFGGWKDLLARRLRTVGDAHLRFSEDALRMLRGVRLTLSYDLTPEPDLIAALDAELPRVDSLSVERITYELKRMMRSPHGQPILAFQTTQILAAIAKRLLGLSPDSRALTKLLARWIRPTWHAEQTLPLFYLACQLSQYPQLANPLQNSAEQLALLRQILSPAALRPLPHLLLQNCKLSRAASRQGHAMLYAAGLRLWLERPEGFQPLDWARLFRVLHKTLALDVQSVHRSTLDGFTLLDCALPDVPGLIQDLLSLRQQIQLDLEVMPVFELPVLLKSLQIQGSHPQFKKMLRGKRLGLVLERLLSHVQLEPEDNTPDQLAKLVQIWHFIG